MSSHWYKAGELVPPNTPGAYPSATTILGVAAKPGLYEWWRRVGFEAADIKQQESSELGTRVHKALETLIQTNDAGMNIVSYSDDLNPFLNGYINWANKYNPTEPRAETFIQSELHEYAGTADLICEIEGEQWIVDFKTSKAIHPEYALQLAAYAWAWQEMGHGPSRRAVLQLTPELQRGYRWKEFTDDDDFGVFMAHKAVFDWQQQFVKAPALTGPVWEFKQ